MQFGVIRGLGQPDQVVRISGGSLVSSTASAKRFGSLASTTTSFSPSATFDTWTSASGHSYSGVSYGWGDLWFGIDSTTGQAGAVDPLGITFAESVWWQAAVFGSRKAEPDPIETLYVRSFAPWQWFGPEIDPTQYPYICYQDCFAGDSRSFSTLTSPLVTSRITAIVSFQLPRMTIVRQPCGPKLTLMTPCAYSDASYDVFNRTATGKPRLIVNPGNGKLHMEYAGSNPLQPLAPDIDTKLDISATNSPQQACYSGQMSGDAFPYSEAFVNNSSAASTTLVTFATPFDRNWAGPLLLFGDFNRDMGSFSSKCVPQ